MIKPQLDTLARANMPPTTRESEIAFKVSRIKRQQRPARWKAEKIAALRAQLSS